MGSALPTVYTLRGKKNEKRKRKGKRKLFVQEKG
jgi:hypothetical protein